MVLEQLKETKITLPVVGAVSFLGVAAVGLVILFMSRRKKSINLKF